MHWFFSTSCAVILLLQVEIKNISLHKNTCHIYFFFENAPLAASRSSSGVLKTSISSQLERKYFLREVLPIRRIGFVIFEGTQWVKFKKCQEIAFHSQLTLFEEKKNRVGIVTKHFTPQVLSGSTQWTVVIATGQAVSGGHCPSNPAEKPWYTSA